MAEGPLPTPAEKGAVVRRMFGAIAPRYDLLNHLLSLNRDRAWRRWAVDQLQAESPEGGDYLDSCAGTLDLAREIAGRTGFRGRVLACDFSLPMLQRGGEKVDGLPVGRVCADALMLPVRDARFDGAVVGFGVRNLASVQAGLAEFARVLRPGGKLVILEFTTPTRQPIRSIYLFYFRGMLPWIGRFVSKHRSAYAYLPASVLEFPAPAELGRLLSEAGFENVTWNTFSAGIVAVHEARRAQTSA